MESEHDHRSGVSVCKFDQIPSPRDLLMRGDLVALWRATRLARDSQTPPGAKHTRGTEQGPRLPRLGCWSDRRGCAAATYPVSDRSEGCS